MHYYLLFVECLYSQHMMLQWHTIILMWKHWVFKNNWEWWLLGLSLGLSNTLFTTNVQNQQQYEIQRYWLEHDVDTWGMLHNHWGWSLRWLYNILKVSINSVEPRMHVITNLSLHLGSNIINSWHLTILPAYSILRDWSLKFIDYRVELVSSV